MSKAPSCNFVKLRGWCALIIVLICHTGASQADISSSSRCDTFGALSAYPSSQALLQISATHPATAFGVQGRKVAKTIAGVPVHNYEHLPPQVESEDLRLVVNSSRLAHEWLVKLKDGLSDQALSAFCRALPGKSRCLAQGHPSEGGIPLVVVEATEEELEKQLQIYHEQSEYVEPDMPMDAIPEVGSEVEDDDANTSAWNAATSGVPASWGLDRVDDRSGLDNSFDIDPQGGVGVHIYVADTGVRTTHEDFQGRAIPTFEIRNGTIHECEAGETECALDDNGHGTHAAAIAAGIRYGVAKASTIHAIKILSGSGHGKMSALIQALDWVTTKGHRPAIFTASVGGVGNPPSVERAIEVAIAAGVTVIVAAGNFGRDACSYSPAHTKAAITVGATEDADDRIAPYSNFGRCIDVFAPGSNINSAGRFSDTAKATMSGTSMACPHVAGAAALLLGQDSSRTPEEIAALLKARATQGTIKGAPGESPSRMLYIPAFGVDDGLWWQASWSPNWLRLFQSNGWAGFLQPGPMKELIAEACVSGIFLLSLVFVLSRCLRSSSNLELYDSW